LRNHSPDGFSWGYNGSGPAQFALAILYQETGDKNFALKHYQNFKQSFIAGLKGESHKFDSTDIEPYFEVYREADEI
jgi:hypothetical protein